MRSVFLLFLWTLGFATAAHAQQRPREIDQHFSQERRGESPVFQTLPLTHITPQADSFIFAAMVNYVNATATGKATAATNGQKAQPSEDLKIKGYAVAPHLAYSGKILGGGLAFEAGEGDARYRQQRTGYSEQGKIKYSGFGGHLFLNPLPEVKFAVVTLVGGAKSLAVNHTASSNQMQPDLAAGKAEAISYYVVRSQLGGNINFKILSGLSLIPWVNYVDTNSSGLRKELKNGKDIHYAERFLGDEQLFWQNSSPLNYGIDVAIRISRFQFHIGNLLGTLLDSRKSESQRIKDYSLTLGIIFRS